jgi:hypothetical protein
LPVTEKEIYPDRQDGYQKMAGWEHCCIHTICVVVYWVFVFPQYVR